MKSRDEIKAEIRERSMRDAMMVIDKRLPDTLGIQGYAVLYLRANTPSFVLEELKEKYAQQGWTLEIDKEISHGGIRVKIT